ncbi:50S ribosomal protein L33 [bacterium]|nr:50S ribosomal protein L33 [bacterium]
MAKKQARALIVLKNPKTGTLYFTNKNSLNSPDKIVLKKYDKKTRKVETFTESKMKLG